MRILFGLGNKGNEIAVEIPLLFPRTPRAFPSRCVLSRKSGICQRADFDLSNKPKIYPTELLTVVIVKYFFKYEKIKQCV